MFKLLKELAKAPEPLLPPSSHRSGTPSAGGSGHGSGNEDGHGHEYLPYTVRSRSGTATTIGRGRGSPSAGPSRSASRRPSVGDDAGKEDESEAEGDMDEHGVKVLQLLASLRMAGGAEDIMRYVEAFSQLLSLPSTTTSRRVFRRRGGFKLLLGSFDGALGWRALPQGKTEEEYQVEAVQRLEGIRLAFELLSWAQGDEEGLAYFERLGGYNGLLPKLYKLSEQPVKDVQDSESAIDDERLSVQRPDPSILGHLLSHIASSDYSCISLFDGTSPDTDVGGKLNNPKIRWGNALHLLLAYTLGSPVTFTRSPTFKGKEKDQAESRRFKRRFLMGLLEFEPSSPQGGYLLETLLRALTACAEASIVNLFTIQTHLPHLSEWLIMRIYGPAPDREYAITFPPREGWAAKGPGGEAEGEPPVWRAPSPSLRRAYLALLRKMLEAGASREITWRLFALVRREDTTQPLRSPSPGASASSSPSPSPYASPTPHHGALVGSPTPSGENTPSKSKRKRPPGLLKLQLPSSDGVRVERLDEEVLDLIGHGIKSRWPALFVLSGGVGEVGGLELRDSGRNWSKGEKGISFSAWIYITKLNQPITLLHCSQAAAPFPFLHVKILENSQISIATTQHHPATPAPAPAQASSSAPPTSTTGDTAPRGPDDIICPAPDALIPHGQWTHFALNLRHPKGGEYGEARLYVNGIRVGAMRMAYPIPIPPVPVNVAPQSQASAGAKVNSGEVVRIALGREIRGTFVPEEKQAVGGGRTEENEWMLGRVLMLEEAMNEDLILLLHHLGPRYCGNLQEPLGKFLTYEGATSINIYLHNLARSAKDKKLFSQPATATLVRAIRTGPAISEESVLLSLNANNTILDDSTSTSSLSSIPANDPGAGLSKLCINGSIPHPDRARHVRNGTARLVGRIEPFRHTAIDETVAAVGGGTIVLKIIDMSRTSEQLLAGLGMLRDLTRDNWAASEEMERIHGFDLLAAILRPKMAQLVDIPCANIILSILGINTEHPSTATVHNSVAYRALGLDFELWSGAPIGVISVYLQHFASLLTTSKHARYNVLRTFQKSAMVKRLLYAMRSGSFDPAATQMLVDTLSIALTARWSGEDAIKPTFSYLVSALCQNNAVFGLGSMTDPPPSQLAASLTLASLVDLLRDEQRLVKLNRAIALHRLLVIFISSNSAYYVIIPCLQILQLCLSTPGLESFQRSFEGEGGFALIGRTLGPVWRRDLQELVWSMLVDESSDKTALLCVPLITTVTSAMESLLVNATETDDSTVRPSAAMGRTRSGTVTSIRSIAITPVSNGASTPADAIDTRLEDLFRGATGLYKDSSAFRRAISTKRVESMLPYLADFATVSASSSKPGTRQKRTAASNWLSVVLDKSKSRLPNSVIEQIKLIKEQLNIISPTPTSSAGPASPLSPSSPLSPGRASIGAGGASFFGSSLTSRLASSPAGTITPGSESLRRRLSTDSTMSAMTPIEPLVRRPSDAGLARVKSGREKRIPLQRTLTGESILEGGKDKNAAWKLIIMQTDLQSHGKMTLERKEHWRRLCQEDWPKQAAQLRGELGIWPTPLDAQTVTWRLDGSEGPLRMRNRLERVTEISDGSSTARGKGSSKLRDAIPTADELSSAVSRMNVAPWEDPFSLALGEASIAEEEPAPTLAAAPTDSEQSSTNAVQADRLDDESFVEVEDDKDDKMRRIARTLQAGDVVEQAHNIVRIVGVDACPGLLILGRKNLYLIDGLVQTPSGDVIDAKDAPRDALSIPSGTLVELDAIDQQSARWSYSEIVESNKRAFLFRDVALELYFSDKRNFLIVFRDQRERSVVVQKLSSKDEQRDAISRSIIGNFVLDQVARATDRSEQQLTAMTRKWQNREISNFAYLQLLNQHANRTPNDVTQYPVFPWVITDYTSPVLDTTKESTYRNLNLPMGALTESRQEAAVERYSATVGIGEKPFHYGTHYSSSMIVCGFMIRMSPFTEIFLALQGGNFDLADRLFSSIPRAWDSASCENRGDVRELIPEFFYSAGFLKNMNHHDFGITQGSNEQVDDVTLPAWALDDPLLFIHRHREALESDYVSKHLHSWIDLVFGYKQRDPASYNCYHPLSYRGAVDLDKMKDESEKAASTAIIHNFGQTPVQIFRQAHPQRYISRNSELPLQVKFGVAEQWPLLMRSILPITETARSTRIDLIHPATIGMGGGAHEDAKPHTYPKCKIPVPGNGYLSVQYGFTDQSLRVYFLEITSKLVHIIEGIPTEHALFASPTLLVTVSPLSIITAWRLSVRSIGSRRGDVSLTREATLRGHSGKVTCVGSSKAWSFMVTGSHDGTAAVWDTNRLRYIRTITTPRKEPIRMCAIHECDGTIALASAHHMYLYSLNGYAIASAHVEADDIFASLPRFTFGFGGDEPVAKTPEFTGGITFLNREFLKFGALFVVGIGSELALFRCMPGSRAFGEESNSFGDSEEKTKSPQPWSIVEQGRLSGSDDHDGGDCTAVRFIGETLYAAFEPEEGEKNLLYQWSLPEGNARHVAEPLAHTCMAEQCGKHFGLLEPRRFCGGCGGAFCGTHAVHVVEMEKRYCEHCRSQLSLASVKGILGNRRDSVTISSRRNSIATRSRRPSLLQPGTSSSSRPGSRRPSISNVNAKTNSGAARAGSPAPAPAPASAAAHGSGSVPPPMGSGRTMPGYTIGF